MLRAKRRPSGGMGKLMSAKKRISRRSVSDFHVFPRRTKGVSTRTSCRCNSLKDLSVGSLHFVPECKIRIAIASKPLQAIPGRAKLQRHNRRGMTASDLPTICFLQETLVRKKVELSADLVAESRGPRQLARAPAGYPAWGLIAKSWPLCTCVSWWPLLPLHSQSSVTAFPFFPVVIEPLEPPSSIWCNCAPLNLGARVHSFEPPLSLILPTQALELPRDRSANRPLFIRIDRLSSSCSGFLHQSTPISAIFDILFYYFSPQRALKSWRHHAKVTTCSTDH